MEGIKESLLLSEGVAAAAAAAAVVVIAAVSVASTNWRIHCPSVSCTASQDVRCSGGGDGGRKGDDEAEAEKAVLSLLLLLLLLLPLLFLLPVGQEEVVLPGLEREV